MTLKKLRIPIITKCLLHSLGIGAIGFIVVMGPLLWVFMHAYMAPENTNNTHVVGLALGAITMKYVTLVKIFKEALLCGTGLGVTTMITWAESSLDGIETGNAITSFGIISGIGSLCLFFLYVGLTGENLDPNLYNDRAAKFLIASFNILFVLIIMYFLTIFLLRRKKDLGANNG